MKTIRTEMASDGDTGERQLVVYLGTKSEKTAKKRAEGLINKFNLLQKKRRKPCAS